MDASSSPRERFVQRHHAVADLVIARDHDHQHAAVRQRDQLDMFQRGADLANGGGDADAAGQVHQHARRVFDALLHGFETAEFAAQAFDFRRGHPAQSQGLPRGLGADRRHFNRHGWRF